MVLFGDIRGGDALLIRCTERVCLVYKQGSSYKQGESHRPPSVRMALFSRVSRSMACLISAMLGTVKWSRLWGCNVTGDTVGMPGGRGVRGCVGERVGEREGGSAIGIIGCMYG